MSVLVLALGVVPALVLASPADAHRQRGLDARIVPGSSELSCFSSGVICAVDGRVRVFNRRAAGTGPVGICVGIDAHTAGHRLVSVEPLRTAGQAVALLRPGQSRVVSYRTMVDLRRGEPHHVHVVHVHVHVAQTGGQMC